MLQLTPIDAGETISVAIGQGAVTVSPLQIVTAIGGIAVGGEWFKPHLLRERSAGIAAARAISKQANVEQVNLGMSAVVNEGGTGRAALLPGIKVAGKRGRRSWPRAISGLKVRGCGSALANNAWFVGFAPLENPEIAVVALFENGEESYNAVPIVRDVIKAYFDKKEPQRGEHSKHGNLEWTFAVRAIRSPATAGSGLDGRSVRSASGCCRARTANS